MESPQREPGLTPLGQRVRELRKARGLRSTQLAARGGFSHTLIASLETGRRKYVTPIDIAMLAAALEVPESELWDLIPAGKSERRYVPIGDWT